uniref:Uncharacterized protein n=1 Tax=Micrurus paraensis TaxID=1970185 RepID=A0A2D4KEM2_9SAUR
MQSRESKHHKTTQDDAGEKQCCCFFKKYKNPRTRGVKNSVSLRVTSGLCLTLEGGQVGRGQLDVIHVGGSCGGPRTLPVKTAPELRFWLQHPPAALFQQKQLGRASI